MYDNLNAQMQELRRQQTDLTRTNQNVKKQLEERKRLCTENVISSKNIDLLQLQLFNFEKQIQTYAKDLSAIKFVIDQQNNDLTIIKSKLQNFQTIDNKNLTSTQILEHRLREVHNQLLQFKQSMKNEVEERLRNTRAQTEFLTRLQDHVRQQEVSKNTIFSNILRRNDLEKEKQTNEINRLNDKILNMSNKISKEMNEKELKLRDEFMQRSSTIYTDIKSELEVCLTNHAKEFKQNEERWQNQNRLIEDLQEIVTKEKDKYHDRFQKVSNALNAIEKYMELGNEKIDKIMNTEIQSRKLHEKGLLNKIDKVESQLNFYLNNLTKTVEDVKTGVSNIRIPVLDTEALSCDMETIAADKSKLSMEGLLKLEERITRMQHGLNRDRRELQCKIGSAIERDINNKLRYHIQKLDNLMDEVENAQNRIRDKLERQVPKDLTELCAKVDNLKTQITNRIDQEEEERFLAIKELQDVYGQIVSGACNEEKELPGIANIFPVSSSSLKRDIDECKVAIKKLAESVTTVKNVLDCKIQSEIKRREHDIEVLGSRLDALAMQIFQQQNNQPQQFR